MRRTALPSLLLAAAVACGSDSKPDSGPDIDVNTGGNFASSGGSASTGGNTASGGNPAAEPIPTVTPPGTGGSATDPGPPPSTGGSGSGTGGSGSGTGTGGATPIPNPSMAQAGADACTDSTVPFETRCAACVATDCDRCVCHECTAEAEACEQTPGCADPLRCATGGGNGPCKDAIVKAPSGREPTLDNPSAGPASDAAVALSGCMEPPAGPCATQCQ